MLAQSPLQQHAPTCLTTAQLDRRTSSDASNDILETVLQQIELEQSRRRFLEAQIQELSESIASDIILDEEEYLDTPQPAVPEQTTTRRDYASLQAETQGYLQVFNAISNSRPAVAAAIARMHLLLGSSPHEHLPLQALRLLEVMPWHPWAQRYTRGKDEICEWQVLDVQRQEWKTSSILEFPSFFHTLPIVSSGHEHDHHQSATCCKDEDASFLDRNHTVSHSDSRLTATKVILDTASALAGMIASKMPFRQDRVLTNTSLTQRYILHSKLGYALPDPITCGTWKWIGCWKIETQLGPNAGGETTDTDGWLYFKNTSPLDSPYTHDYSWTESNLLNTLGESETLNYANDRHGHILRMRKWARDRVLIDYPLASPYTKEYLRLLSHTASLTDVIQELQLNLDNEQLRYDEIRDEQEEAQERQESQLEYYKYKLDRLKDKRLGRFKHKVEQLMYKTEDVLAIISDPNQFHELQKALRRSGAVTNTILRQGLHFYIYDHVRNMATASKTAQVM